MTDEAAWLARTVVIGNSGAGKSWLAGRIAEAAGAPAIDLDVIHWCGDGFAVQRDEAEARALARAAAGGERWVIEGVYGWLAGEAMPRATALMWLDLLVQDCLDGLGRRGPRGGDASTFAALLAWAGDYETRVSSSSRTGHRHLFESFAGPKRRIATQAEATAFAAGLAAP